MKYFSVFKIIVIAVITYFLSKWINPPKEIVPIIIAGLAAFISLLVSLLVKNYSVSGKIEGSLKAQLDSAKEEKSKLKEKHREEVDSLKKTHEKKMSELKEKYYTLGQDYVKLKKQAFEKPPL